MLGRSNWRSMGSHRAAFPGMFAEGRSSPDRHNIEAFSRLSSSGNISTHHFVVWLSLFLTQHCSKSLAENVAALPIPQLIGLVV